jgi:TolB-like protein
MNSFIVRHEGRVLDMVGDAALAEFGSAVEAVRCAIAIQEEIATRNVELPDDRKLRFRIGINIGDVLVKGDTLYGDGVNVAARLEALAEPGGICTSDNVFNQVKHKMSIGFEGMGPQEVKNISEPVDAFRIVPGQVSVQGATATPAARRRWRIPVIATVVVIIVAIAGGIAWWQPWAPKIKPGSVARMAHPLPDKPSIAVLPFVNMSDDPKQEHFVDGLTEDVITGLSNLEDLVVISRSSVFTYKGKAIKVNEVAQELGVRYVLEGSVRKSGDRVRITTQLVDATTGHHLWADRFDHEMKDIFAVQDEITQKVVQILGGYAVKPTKADTERRLYEGVGVVIGVNLEKSRLVLKMQEIKGFMASMPMNSQVKPATLLQGLNPGEKIRFTFDTVTRTITAISQMEK